MNPQEEYYFKQAERAEALRIKNKYLFPKAFLLLKEIKK